MTTVSRWCTRFSYVQWRKNCPCRPYNAGGPARVGGPCANPQKNYFHDIVVCTVVQHNLLRIVRIVRSLGGGPYDHVLQPLQGGPEFVVTPLLTSEFIV